MPTLIIVCGYVGSGKTTVARELSKVAGLEVISSDVVRKMLAGIPVSEHRYEDFSKGIYSPEFTERTYKTLIEEAKKRLREGKSVILDATFSKKWQREMARKVAMEADANFLCIETVCPDTLIKNRLDKRMKKVSVSDGRWEIFQKHKESFEKIDEFSPKEHIIVRTDAELKNELEKVLERIRLFFSKP